MSEETQQKEQKPSKSGYYIKQPSLKTSGTSKIKQQFGKGMTIFIVIAACILFYFALLRLTVISAVVGKIIQVLKPIIYGMAIAYLLNPIVKKVDK